MDYWEIFIVLAILALFPISYRLEAHSRRADVKRLRQGFSQRSPASVAGLAPEVSSELAERVRQVLAKVSEEAAKPEPLRIDPTLIRMEDDLGGDLGFCLDSLAFYEMLLELEKEFGPRFRLSDFRLGDIFTVGEVVQVVAGKLSSQIPSAHRKESPHD